MKGVFFVEALHSAVLGDEQLRRIVDMIGSRGHEIQMHCHVEWLWFHEGSMRLPRSKRNIGDLTEDEQVELLGLCQDALARCGVQPPTAFRAGNYGAADSTLRALARLDMSIDSSLNRTARASGCVISLPDDSIAPTSHHGVVEVPISWFHDFGAHVRHAQLCAVSCRELRYAIAAADRLGHPVFNIVSHSFELLNRARSRRQAFVTRRFEKLCHWLDMNRDRYPTRGFCDIDWRGSKGAQALKPVMSGSLRGALRMGEQILGNYIYE